MAPLSNTLVYVDKQLILPIGVKLLGSSLATRDAESVEGGFNWFVAAKMGYTGETSTEIRVSELFPEDIFLLAYEQIVRRNNSETRISVLVSPVYPIVDKQLILPIGVKLLGSSLATRDAESVEGGFNWFVAAKMGYTGETSTEIRVSELFPEDIFLLAYEQIVRRNLRVHEYSQQVNNHTIELSNVISVNGLLRFPDIELKPYDPFQPPDNLHCFFICE